MLLIQVAAGVLVLLAAVVCLYHAVLGAVGFFTHGRNPLIQGGEVHSFAIVIPAHNEEEIITQTLRSCDQLDYPKEKLRVYVIADNCSDRTAQVAEQHGAVCLVRNDEHNRGKGYALEWALPRVLAHRPDAVVVLDADCRIDAHAIRVFNQCLNDGAKVLQANYVVGNPDDSPISYLLALGNLVANDLFHAPKSILGWPVLLLGSGMVLHREILERFPWKASSLCEDTEYSLLLHRHGIPARFVAGVRVASDFPVSHSQFVAQRRRWIKGQTTVAWKHGLKLVWEGLLKRSPSLVDAGLSSIIVFRAFILAHLLLTALLVALCLWLAPGPFSTIMGLTLLGIGAAYSLYAFAGVYLLGLTRRRLWLLLQSPFVVASYLWLSLTTLLTTRPIAWEKTPRVERSA